MDKITRESTIFGFVAFLLPSFLKICLGSFVMYLVGYIYEVTPDQLNPEDYPCSVDELLLLNKTKVLWKRKILFLARVPVKC